MVILESFPIQKGAHCASTSLSEIMQYNGFNLSESMVFGMSSGLDFVYCNQFHESNSRLVFTRSPMLEVDFFKNIGINYVWNKEVQPDFNTIIENINSGYPMLFLTDPSILDFFDAKIPSAAGHALTLIGYDELNKSVMISDSISSDILSCSYDNLCASINVKKPPFYMKNLWGVVTPIKPDMDFEKIIVNSLKNNAMNMLRSESPHRGINAINKLYKEIPHWSDLPDYRTLCSTVYHSIENIGTGGSGFRNLYTQFLREINDFTNEIDTTTLVNQKINLAKIYRKLSKVFYLESLNREKSYVSEIQDILYTLAETELTFWEKVLKDLK